MPAIEFTYCDDDGFEYECRAEYDPPDLEAGLPHPVISDVTVTLDGQQIMLDAPTVDAIRDFAFQRLTRPN